MALLFPLYRFVEPRSREASREDQLASLAASGQTLWSFNCASCHGISGEGDIGPALNSEQFLQSATDEQVELLVAVGIPGSQMSAFSQDFGGPLTSEQIKAVVVYVRSWEADAPDRPDWRDGPAVENRGARQRLSIRCDLAGSRSECQATNRGATTELNQGERHAPRHRAADRQSMTAPRRSRPWRQRPGRRTRPDRSAGASTATVGRPVGPTPESRSRSCPPRLCRASRGLVRDT